MLIVTAHAKDELGKGPLEKILGDVVLQGPGVYMEKPVKPLNYVRCIQRTLGIQISEDVSDKINLKEEVQSVLQNADPETLRKALEVLKKS